MKWSFVLEGRPPSVNHSYTQVVVMRNGRPIRTVAKNKDVEAYQLLATYVIKLARPKGWEWAGQQLRIYLDFFLKRDADADNMMKAVLDSIAHALNVNDKAFLPCARSKVVNGKEKNPRVVVEIDDEIPSA